MGLNERLYRDLERNERKRNSQDPYYADEPDWMIYEDRKMGEPLNRFKGSFAVKDETSINTAPSVFEKGTIFRTDGNK